MEVLWWSRGGITVAAMELRWICGGSAEELRRSCDGVFDVLMGMDRLSKRKFGIVCHGKVVRIPLEGKEILRVHGERTQGVVKTLMNTKVVEFRAELVPGATPVVKSPYRLAPLDMQELFAQLQELQDEELELLRKEKLYAKSSVKDKILANSSETSKVENMPAEMLRDLDQQMVKRADDGWSLVLWAEIRESSLTGPELVLDMTNKVVLRKEKLKAARDRQKSYADNRRKPLEFEVGDRVMLKVSPWKGVIHFGKKGKLAPSLQVPLDEIKVDKTLCFVEEPIENSDREVKRLKCSRMVVAKVHLGSKRAYDNTKNVPSYDAKAVSEVNVSSTVHEQMSHVKRKTIIQTTDVDQIDSSIIFDDPFVENNGGMSEHDSNVHDEYREIQMLAYNV
ncbi:hypothetical protein Tco_0267248 [Tanacetum coccineum]